MKTKILLRSFIISVRHGVYFMVDCKVIKMKRLNESHVRAQTVRLFEENNSFGVMAKQLVAV